MLYRTQGPSGTGGFDVPVVALLSIVIASSALAQPKPNGPIPKPSSTSPAVYTGCHAAIDTNEKLGEFVRREIRSRTPARYLDIADEIEATLTSNSSEIVPHVIDNGSRKLVVVPANFAKLLCAVVYANYLAHNKDSRANSFLSFDDILTETAACTSQEDPNLCFLTMTKRLERRHAASIALLNNSSRNSLNTFYKGALAQILLHEYAHHYLNHVRRIRSRELDPFQAEFDADFLAMMTGVQAGDPPTSLHYWFGIMGHIDALRPPRTQRTHPSDQCRMANFFGIADTVDFVPIVVIETASGLGDKLPEAMIQRIDQMLAEPLKLPENLCSSGPSEVLSGARAELKQLYQLLKPQRAFLQGEVRQREISKLAPLVDKLARMSREFQYVPGLAARCLSLILAGHNKADGEMQSLMALNSLQSAMRLESRQSSEFMSADLGRLLETQAQEMFYRQQGPAREQVMFTLVPRILKEAVTLNPQLTDAWMMLSLISFKLGSCGNAHKYGLQSLGTANEQDAGTEKMIAMFGILANDEERCKKLSSGFAFPPSR